MKKFIFYAVIFFLHCILNARIIDSDNFELIRDHVDQDTLVIFDIDNTVARTEQEFGSDEWFCYLVDQKIAVGYDYDSAIYLTLPLAYYAQFNLPLRLTDSALIDIFNYLDTNHINTLALTSRSLFLAERTYEQLKNIGIIFNLFHPHLDEFPLSLTYPCLYTYNMVFCSNNNKGIVLLTLLDMINYYPKKIIFIDDKMSHVTAVEQALRTTDIEYIGIRYSGCDHYVHNFDPEKAQQQLNEIKEKNTNNAPNLK